MNLIFQLQLVKLKMLFLSPKYIIRKDSIILSMNFSKKKFYIFFTLVANIVKCYIKLRLLSTHLVTARVSLYQSIKKLDVNNPDNYRGITLLSQMSKLFTSILNKRLLSLGDFNSVVTDAHVVWVQTRIREQGC